MKSEEVASPKVAWWSERARSCPSGAISAWFSRAMRCSRISASPRMSPFRCGCAVGRAEIGASIRQAQRRSSSRALRRGCRGNCQVASRTCSARPRPRVQARARAARRAAERARQKSALRSPGRARRISTGASDSLSSRSRMTSRKRSPDPAEALLHFARNADVDVVLVAGRIVAAVSERLLASLSPGLKEEMCARMGACALLSVAFAVGPQLSWPRVERPISVTRARGDGHTGR